MRIHSGENGESHLHEFSLLTEPVSASLSQGHLHSVRLSVKAAPLHKTRKGTEDQIKSCGSILSGLLFPFGKLATPWDFFFFLPVMSSTPEDSLKPTFYLTYWFMMEATGNC